MSGRDHSVVEDENTFLVKHADLFLTEDEMLDRPARRRSLNGRDLVDVSLATIAAGTTAIVLRLTLDWNGLMSTVVWWYLLFVALYFVLVRDRTSSEVAVDKAVTIVVWSLAALIAGVLGWMIVYLTAKGLKLLRPGFLTSDMRSTGPLTTGGGVKAAIIGSFEQVGMATAFVVPVAVLTAVYLNEIKGRLSPFIRFIVNALSGLPSIVAGLVIFAAWVNNGHGFSGAAGAAALAVLMLPIVTRTSEEILRTIPDSLREASLALGAPQWRVVLRVVLPTAQAGLLTGVILGIARAVGETAPVLLTALGSDATNWNPFHGPQASLPLFVWQLIREPNLRQNDRAWTGALVLVFLVIALFALARLLLARSQRKLGRSR